MTTYPTYLQFGENAKRFYRNLSSEQARDERFAVEEIDLHFFDGETYSIDYKYEAPLLVDGAYYYIFKESNADLQQQSE